MTTIALCIGTSIIIAGLLYLILNKKIEQVRSSSQVLDEIRSEVNQIIVELNQTTDRNIGLVEERMQTLNRLIENADRRVSVLKKETDKYTMSTATYNQVRPKVPVANAQQESKNDSVEEKKRQEQTTPGDTKGEGDLLSRAQESHEPAQDSGKDEVQKRREMILSLYNQGISPEIIASRLDSTIAEVELIISMTGDHG